MPSRRPRRRLSGCKKRGGDIVRFRGNVLFTGVIGAVARFASEQHVRVWRHRVWCWAIPFCWTWPAADRFAFFWRFPSGSFDPELEPPCRKRAVMVGSGAGRASARRSLVCPCASSALRIFALGCGLPPRARARTSPESAQLRPHHEQQEKDPYMFRALADMLSQGRARARAESLGSKVARSNVGAPRSPGRSPLWRLAGHSGRPPGKALARAPIAHFVLCESGDWRRARVGDSDQRWVCVLVRSRASRVMTGSGRRVGKKRGKRLSCEGKGARMAGGGGRGLAGAGGAGGSGAGARVLRPRLAAPPISLSNPNPVQSLAPLSLPPRPIDWQRAQPSSCPPHSPHTSPHPPQSSWCSTCAR